MNSHLALLSAQKATETIIPGLHLRPLQLGQYKRHLLYGECSL